MCVCFFFFFVDSPMVQIKRRQIELRLMLKALLSLNEGYVNQVFCDAFFTHTLLKGLIGSINRKAFVRF